MSNRDVAPRLRALDERVTELEGVEEQLVEIYIALDGLPFSEMVEGRPYAKHLNAVEQIKRLRADLVSARAEHQRTESELNQAQLDKRRAEDDRDEWERHLHIERREHQKAIEERDRARAEVELNKQWRERGERIVELLKLIQDGWYVNPVALAQFTDELAALKETP